MTPEMMTVLVGMLGLTGCGGFLLAILKFPSERSAAVVGMQSDFIEEIQADREALRARVQHLEEENRALHNRVFAMETAMRRAGLDV